MRRICQPALVLAAAVALLGAHRALAVDGVIEISHDRALVGGVTPGDAPGYPVTLSVSGSYVLTSDLKPRTSGGIEITADRVTLDLNGFRVRCFSLQFPPPPERCGGANGVGISTGDYAVIRGGVVDGFPGIGIMTGEGNRLEDLRVESNGDGILMGRGSSLDRSVVAVNAGDGVRALLEADAIAVRNSQIVQNGRGIVLRGGIASGNLVLGNLQEGIETEGLGGLSVRAPLIVDNQISKNAVGIRFNTPAGWGRNALSSNLTDVIFGTAPTRLAPNLCSTAFCP